MQDTYSSSAMMMNKLKVRRHVGFEEAKSEGDVRVVDVAPPGKVQPLSVRTGVRTTTSERASEATSLQQ